MQQTPNNLPKPNQRREKLLAAIFLGDGPELFLFVGQLSTTVG